jgi:hypothetical protein
MAETFILKDCPRCGAVMRVHIARKTCQTCGAYFKPPKPKEDRKLVEIVHIYSDGTTESHLIVQT